MSIKILIVDDEKELCEMVQTSINRRPDFEAIVCTDPRNVEPICLAENPDLLLLDLVMPDISGADIVKTLKNNPKTDHIKIIITSGLGEMTYHAKKTDHPWKWEPNRKIVKSRPDNIVKEDSTEIAADKYGVERYLKKPFSPTSLMEVLMEVSEVSAKG